MAIDVSSFVSTSQYLVRNAKSSSTGTDAKSVSSSTVSGANNNLEAGPNGQSQAHVFNEKGFFGNITGDKTKSGMFRQMVTGAQPSRKDVTSSNLPATPDLGDSDEAAEIAKKIANAARKMDSNQFVDFVDEVLKEVGREQIFRPTTLNSGPDSREPAGNTKAEIANANLGAIYGEPAHMHPKSNALHSAPKEVGEPLSSSQIVKLVTSDQQKTSSPVRVALREIDGGLNLVAQLGGLKKQDRENIRGLIAGILAQYGYGQHDLLLNGIQYSKLFSER